MTLGRTHNSTSIIFFFVVLAEKGKLIQVTHLLLPIKYCPPLVYCRTVVDVLCKDVISEIKKNFFTVQLKHHEGI